MEKIALIVAGGKGKRMNRNLPKQFEILNGKPVLMHTFHAFYGYDPDINFILVLPENQFDYWEGICREHEFGLKHELVAGGETRFHSVKNGLAHVPVNSVVFIHDGVRPLVSATTIENCYNTALINGNALPVVPVTESLRKVENEQNFSADRSKYFLVQTPQTFLSEKIKNAYARPFSDKFTDDASVLESTGGKISLVDGNRENIKITYPQDLIIAEALLGKP